MRITIGNWVLLMSVGLAASASAQQPQKPATFYTDLSATYAAERSETVPGNCCFWLQGGGVDAALTLWNGLGVAAALTGDHASSVAPGTDVNKLAYLVGPRYTHTAWRVRDNAHSIPHYQIYGQGLFGGAHGFDGVYPSGSSTANSANAFSLLAGGGVNYFPARNLGLRLLELSYVRTQLSNGASNSQNDLRLAFGVTVHIQHESQR